MRPTRSFPDAMKAVEVHVGFCRESFMNLAEKQAAFYSLGPFAETVRDLSPTIAASVAFWHYVDLMLTQKNRTRSIACFRLRQIC